MQLKSCSEVMLSCVHLINLKDNNIEKDSSHSFDRMKKSHRDVDANEEDLVNTIDPMDESGLALRTRRATTSQQGSSMGGASTAKIMEEQKTSSGDEEDMRTILLNIDH